MIATTVSQNSFLSVFEKKGLVNLPSFSGTRVMMMPLVLGALDSVPDFLGHYKNTLEQLFKMTNPKHFGEVGYLTIDEKTVGPNTTHRRAGKHVDGVFQGRCGGWGGGGGWGSVGNGMLTVASHSGCKAWLGEFTDFPGMEGECDHLESQCENKTSEVFAPNTVYWVDGMCVHESLAQPAQVDRQFVRLSMPSSAPWFEGYTKNPLGVKPTGEILPRRQFMNS